MRLLLFSILSILPLCAEQSVSGFVSEEKKAKIEALIPAIRLRGLILTAYGKDPVSLPKQEGLTIQNLEVPGNQAELKNLLEPIFLHKPITEELVTEIKRTVATYYKDHQKPFVVVATPEQNVTSGFLNVTILEGVIGDIRFKGNRFFSDESLLQHLHLSPGDPINTQVLLADVAWMNRNPFHYSDLSLAPGSAAGMTNIDIFTRDRFPFRPYAGIDNTGMAHTGSLRLFAGFNASFWLDHIFTFQYTTSADFKELQAYTINYRAPLSWHHTLLVYGGYAKVLPHISGFSSAGRSYQASARYEIPFNPIYTNFLQELGFGFDFKRTNNNLFFEASTPLPIENRNVNLTQFAFTYNFSNDVRRNKTFLNTELYYSPGAIISDETNFDYQTLRAFAKHNYVYGKVYFRETIKLPKGYEIYGTLRAQLSSANLLASEQFGLGGYDTIRGYAERLLLRDNVFVANLEIHSRPIKAFKSFKVDNKVELLAFVDYGIGKDHIRFPGENPSTYLLGVGPGIRFSIANYLYARFDYGFPLHFFRDYDASGGKHSRAHFGVTASY